MNGNKFSLDGKTVFITGASSGLGACAAVECSKVGATMIITGRDRDRLDSTYSSLEGGGHSQILFDLTSNEIDDLVKELPQLDGLVLCAGITKTLPVKFITEEAITEIFQTNILSSMKLIRGLLKSKKINNGASIVFISSISSFYADKGNSIYAATKGGINSFSRVLALEMAVKQIRSNCIQPGFVPSSFLNAGIITAEQLEQERKNYPLGFGEPTDIANGIIYLLSDASRWVTGTTLTIDGGVTLR